MMFALSSQLRINGSDNPSTSFDIPKDFDLIFPSHHYKLLCLTTKS
jgi:hypothetical protein